jgi:Na+/H+ antiporter NhaC
MNTFLGIFLVSLPFITVFICAARSMGVCAALSLFALTAGTIATIHAGFYLLGA